MGFPTDRIILFDRSMNPLSELAPSEVYSRVRKEELNGEHSLVITTSRQLQEGWRALTVDGTGKWREWVVTETPQEHTAGPNAIGTYRFVWSLQYDLTRSYYHDMTEAVSIGIGSSCTALEAAGHVLTGVSWWTVGTCDGADIIPGGYLSADERTNPIASPKSNKTNSRGRVTGDATQTGCVFIRESAWSKLSKLVECTAYEVDAEIVVSSAFVVTERRLCLRAHLGNPVPLRRFDWGHDVTDIKRTPDPGPYYCRVVPLGKTEKEYADDDVTEFDWPMDITEETGTEQNPGPYWIQDDEAAQVFRIKNPDGTYDYPTVAVEYRSEDDPELLLAAAQADLHNHTRPNVTYEANVLQFARAGMDAQGVTLGDEIQIVDYGFNPDAALRLQGRVTSIEIDELSPETGTSLTIGNLKDSTSDLLSELGMQFDSLVTMHGDIRESLAKMNTTTYVQMLMDRINTEIAATGGYTYLTEGEGIITYDRAVADPLIGTEATRVVQLKGGYLRIADTKKNPFSGIDDWDFKTILDSGHIISDLITAVKITAGYIGNATNNVYINLDSGLFTINRLLEPVIAQSTMSVSGNKTMSTNSAPFDPSDTNSYSTSYFIAFTAPKRVSSNLRVALGYNYSNATEAGSSVRYTYDYRPLTKRCVPTIISKSGSSYRYGVVVTPLDNYRNDRFYLYLKYLAKPLDSTYQVWTGFDDTAYNVTNVRVYKLPYMTRGSIDIINAGNDGLDAAHTNITAGAISMERDGIKSELSPGRLSLSDADYQTSIEFSDETSLVYDDESSVFRLEVNNRLVNHEWGLTNSSPNKMPGVLSREGLYVYQDTNITTTTDTRLSVRGRAWGPFVYIWGQYLLPEEKTIDSSSYYGRNLIVSATIKSDWSFTGTIGTRIYGSGSVYTSTRTICGLNVSLESTSTSSTLGLTVDNIGTYTLPANAIASFSIMFIRGDTSTSQIQYPT